MASEERVEVLGRVALLGGDLGGESGFLGVLVCARLSLTGGLGSGAGLTPGFGSRCAGLDCCLRLPRLFLPD